MMDGIKTFSNFTNRKFGSETNTILEGIPKDM